MSLPFSNLLLGAPCSGPRQSLPMLLELSYFIVTSSCRTVLKRAACERPTKGHKAFPWACNAINGKQRETFQRQDEQFAGSA